jgi:hypothetical protein
MSSIKFQVIIPSEAAEELDLGDTDIRVEPATAADRASLKSAVEFAAAVMTITASSAELIQVSHKISKSLIAWYRKFHTKDHPSAPVMVAVRGRRKDGVMAVSADTDEKDLANGIKRIAES